MKKKSIKFFYYFRGSLKKQEQNFQDNCPRKVKKNISHNFPVVSIYKKENFQEGVDFV